MQRMTFFDGAAALAVQPKRNAEAAGKCSISVMRLMAASALLIEVIKSLDAV